MIFTKPVSSSGQKMIIIKLERNYLDSECFNLFLEFIFKSRFSHRERVLQCPSYHYPSPQTYLSDNTIPITGTPPPIWKWMRVGEGARKAKIGGRHRTGKGRIRPDGGSLPRNEGFQALLVVTEFSTFLFSPPLYIIFSFLCCLRIFLVPTLLPSLSLPFLEPSVYAKLDLKDFPIKKGIFKVFF